MKKIKNMLLSAILLLLIPMVANAATSKFEIKVNNLNTNAITGNFTIANGKIKSITMMNGWENKTGLNYNFYFSNSKIQNGTYVVAVIEVEKTGELVYQVNDLTYHYLKCKQDKFGSYFDNHGNKVDNKTYKKACNISSNTNLKSLKLSTGTLEPNFDSNVTNYTAEVSYTISSINLIGIVEDNKSAISGDINCKLNVGKNICNLIITAEDKTTKTYTINVVRKEQEYTNKPSNPYVIDTSIKDFQIINATLEETFDNNKNDYNIKVDKNAYEIYFKFKMNDVSYTTKPCKISIGTTKCSFTVIPYGSSIKKTYNFYILPLSNQNQTTTNSNNNNNNKNPNLNNPTESNSGDKENNNVVPSLPEQEEITSNNNQEENKKSFFKNINFKIICITILSILIGALLCLILVKYNHKRRFFK